jgi:beta-glucosidase
VKLTDRDSIPHVVAQLSLEEKSSLLLGVTFFRTRALEEYGIPSLYFLDGGTGANFMQAVIDAWSRVRAWDGGIAGLMKQIPSMGQVVVGVLNPGRLDRADQETKALAGETRARVMSEYFPGGELPGSFPPGILLAATWNAEAVYACGRAVGNEARFFGIDVLLGTPNVNVHRNPLNGRLFEGYSEDPHLIAALAPAFVRGVQDEGVIANVKHFAANNQETNRTTINEKISERALREIYLPGFRACVQEGGCRTVMSAYNSINGTPCAHNAWLLRDVLKDEWGFEGFVVSDWGAVYDQVEGIRGGTDLDMPGMRSGQAIIDAVQAGQLSQALIDEAVIRILGVIVDMPASRRPRTPRINRAASAQAAYEAAREGFVLLKNDAGVLPLAPAARVCLFGAHSKQFIESGEGSAAVRTDQSTSLLDALIGHLGEEAVSFEDIRSDTDTVVITVAQSSGEGQDRESLDLPRTERMLLREALSQAKAGRLRTVVILNVCGPVDLGEFLDEIDALVCVFLPGMQGGQAAADLLCGVFSPSGKLPLTFAARYQDYGSSTNFPGLGNEVLYAEDIYVGYRHFDRWDIEPLYPFGHGLTYTAFHLSNPQLSPATVDAGRGEEATLTLEVANVGAMAGKEVVQLYVHQLQSTRPKPPRQLKAFTKVAVEPGTSVTVTFTLDRRIFEEYHEGRHEWVVEPATYELLIGTSSRNLPLTVPVEVTGDNPYAALPISNPLDIFSAD